MSPVQHIVEELREMGSEQTVKLFRNHGASCDMFGVKIADLKKIQKRVKKDYELARQLYDTGISDAMYLAGLIADEKKMTKKDLNQWAKNGSWYMISEYTVPWIAAESNFGWELALEWIESDKENIASSGWSTLSSLVGIKEDKDLDIPALKKLMARVVKEIHESPNRVRHTMNGFIIAVGGHVALLTADALKAGEKIGSVYVDMGGTACKVPAIHEYIKKMKDKGVIGKKKKMARC